MSAFTHRWAGPADLPALRALMDLSIDHLQRAFLTPAQIAASHHVMGLDSQLVEDGTYLAVEEGNVLVGCGGWSRRATLYGGDHSSALRDARLLDPTVEPARVRAMYTHPDHARRGIGRLILARCEAAAAAEGFFTVELMATMAGVPLYSACGYRPIESVAAEVNGVAVPLLRMGKSIAR